MQVATAFDSIKLRDKTKLEQTVEVSSADSQAMTLPIRPAFHLYPAADVSSFTGGALGGLSPYSRFPMAHHVRAAAYYHGYPSVLPDLPSPGVTAACHVTALPQRKRRPSAEAEGHHGERKVKAVPEEKKDESYWERRRKNNEAAKRSRDMRRRKEDEIGMRAALLEQENLKLRTQIAVLKNEMSKLQYMLFNHAM